MSHMNIYMQVPPIGLTFNFERTVISIIVLYFQININGFLSFEEPLSAFKKGFVLPINLRMIAAFVSDIDTSLTGNVYYR